MNILGNKLKALRKGKKLSLEKLGSLTKTSKSYIWALENQAGHANPTADKLYLLSVALDVSIDFLIDPMCHSARAAGNKVVIRKFNKLGDKDRDRVEQIIDNWLKY